MNDNHDLREGFFLDDWRIEPRTGRVTRDGLAGQLEPKIMDVLVLLAASYPSVVARDTFFGTVWHDVNVVEHVLPRAISEIRRELHDDPREPRFIETLPKLGYRLMSPPRLLPTSIETTRPHKRRSNFPIAASFVGGMLTMIVVIVVGLLVLSGGGHH